MKLEIKNSNNYRVSRVYFCAIRAATQLRFLWAFSGESAAPAEQTAGLTTIASLPSIHRLPSDSARAHTHTHAHTQTHTLTHTRTRASARDRGAPGPGSEQRQQRRRTEQAPQRGTSQPSERVQIRP